MQLASGSIVTAALYTATKLGVAELLKGGPKSTRELAQATGAHEDSLFRLLRALASAGVFNESSPRNFELTPVGELLC
jgi:predicted transcriptional regulator